MAMYIFFLGTGIIKMYQLKDNDPDRGPMGAWRWR